MRISILILFAIVAFGQDKPAPKLTAEQRLELSAAMLTRALAEKAVYKLDSDYTELRRKAVEAAQHANGAYGEVVKRLQALAPAGCQLTEAGEFDCKPKPEPKK